MKKIKTNPGMGSLSSCACKILIKMKLTLFLLLACTMSLLADDTYSQSKKLNLHLQGATIKEALTRIEDQSEFYFMYSGRVIDVEREVSVNIEDQKINNVLDQLFAGTDVNYTISDRIIVLTTPEIFRTGSRFSLQQHSVTGTVTDESGEPLPGVTVVVKGTTRGTVTNADGEYSISNIQEDATLVFSFVGMRTQEVVVGDQTNINLVLEKETIGIEEVVAVGYGTVKKSDLTGAVTSVKSDAFEMGVIRSVDDGLQGKAAGVSITQQSGQPGAGFNIKIRGTNSIHGSNDPLFVIDGVPLSSGNSAAGISNMQKINPLATINPADIESVEILKDASAASIYGSRAANGVVLITTKRGKEGKAQIDFNTYHGVQSLIKNLNLVNATDYAIARNEFYEMQGLPALYPNPELLGEGTKWLDKVINENAFVNNYQLSLRGGNESMRYFVSGGRFEQDGIIKHSNFKRNSIRVNINSKISEKLEIVTQLSYSNSKSQSVPQAGRDGTAPDVIGLSLGIPPVYSPKDENGNYYLYIGETQEFNPLAINDLEEYLDLKNRFLGNVSGSYEILNGLKFQVKFGADLGDGNVRVFKPSNSPSGSTGGGIANIGSIKETYWTFEQTLSYLYDFERHSINAVIGHGSEEYQRFSSSSTANNFSTNITGYYDIGAGSTQSVGSGETRWALDSYMSRINYSFDNKYLLTFTGRYDGSSRFPNKNKKAFFPSVALGWKIAEESFFENMRLVNSLKLRASYGLTGEQAIPTYRSLPMMSSGLMYFGDNPQTYYYLSRLGNEDLKWEKTKQLNIGLDIGVFANRLQANVDYFIKNTTDLLFNIPLPPSSSYSEILSNAGEMQNRGFELFIDSKNLVGDFKWNTTFNISFVKNKVAKLYGDVTEIIFSGLNSSGKMQGADNSNILKVGEPLGLIWGYEWDGVFQSEQEAAESGQPGAVIGSIKFKDIEPDGVINENDKTIIADPNPDFFGGIVNTMAYKGFDLNVDFQFVVGRDILNAQHAMNTLIERDINITQEYFDNRWTISNPNGIYPRAGYPSSFGLINSWHVEDGSFLRARNLTLGYTIPKRIRAFRSLRAYLSIDNLFTLTNYSGFNPDVNAYGNNVFSQAIDIGTYPLSKTYTIGLEIGL